MALNINTNITNNLDGYLLDAKNVKGTYVVVADYSELANLPSACVVNGTLVYCQSDYSIYGAGFYQYNGSIWEKTSINKDDKVPTIIIDSTNAFSNLDVTQTYTWSNSSVNTAFTNLPLNKINVAPLIFIAFTNYSFGFNYITGLSNTTIITGSGHNYATQIFELNDKQYIATLDITVGSSSNNLTLSFQEIEAGSGGGGTGASAGLNTTLKTEINKTLSLYTDTGETDPDTGDPIYSEQTISGLKDYVYSYFNFDDMQERMSDLAGETIDLEALINAVKNGTATQLQIALFFALISISSSITIFNYAEGNYGIDPHAEVGVSKVFDANLDQSNFIITREYQSLTNVGHIISLGTNTYALTDVANITLEKSGGGSSTGGGTLWYQHLFTLHDAYNSNDVRICLTLPYDLTTKFVYYVNQAFSTSYTTIAECVEAINQAITYQMITIDQITGLIGALQSIDDDPINSISTFCLHSVDPTYWYQLLGSNSDGSLTAVAGASSSGGGGTPYVLQQKYQLDLPSSIDILITPLGNAGGGGSGTTETGIDYMQVELPNGCLYLTFAKGCFEGQFATDLNSAITTINTAYGTSIPNFESIESWKTIYDYLTGLGSSYVALAVMWLSIFFYNGCYFALSQKCMYNGEFCPVSIEAIADMQNQSFSYAIKYLSANSSPLAFAEATSSSNYVQLDFNINELE